MRACNLMWLRVSFDSHQFSVVFKCFMLCCLVFLLIFVRFRDTQGVLGVLEGPRRALGGLGSSPGRFWDLLGRPGGALGGVQSSLLGGKYVTNTEVLELGRFSVT